MKSEEQKMAEFKVHMLLMAVALVAIILVGWFAPSSPNETMYPGSSATYDGVVSDQSNH